MNVRASLPAFPSPDTLRTPEERAKAAEQFEQVFARQFVKEMTKSLFKQSIAEGGALAAQADTQRDVMTDVLTEYLVESGALGIADLLLARWEEGGGTDHVAHSGARVPPATLLLSTFEEEQPLDLQALREAFASPASDAD